MIEVRQTAAFKAWFAKLRDIRAQAQIVRRIERAQAGNLGDVKACASIMGRATASIWRSVARSW